MCQVTLIEGEDLDYLEDGLGIRVREGQHRRNIVTRGIRLLDLRKKKSCLGETFLEFDRSRSPCRHSGAENDTGRRLP